MDSSINYFQVALAFGGLLVLLGLFYFGARALSSSTTRAGKWRNGQRIGVIDTMPVDGTRRLVLVRRDDTEHLLLLGTHGDLVIESNIPVTARDDASTAATRKAMAEDSGGWPTLRVPGRDPGRDPNRGDR